MKFKFLLSTLIFISAISCAFGQESDALPYLPEDKKDVVWERLDEDGKLIYKEYVPGEPHVSENPYIDASYTGRDGNRYQAVLYRYSKEHTQQTFFAHKIYEMFGFSVPNQYLVKYSKVSTFPNAHLDVAIVIKEENKKLTV